MRQFYTILISLSIIFSNFIFGQTFNGSWSVEYVTPDNEFIPNSIGSRTMSVAALTEDSFVALAVHFGTESYYLAGFRNANHSTGLLGTYEYGPSEKQTKWIDGFNQVFLNEPKDIAAFNGFTYVANNDDDHSILAFELREDSIYTAPQRFKTGDRAIWAIDIAKSTGHVFVTIPGDSSTPGAILVIDDPVNSGWTSQGTNGKILHEIPLPNAGQARGITVNENGTLIYVSNYLTREIYCFIGNPVDGYEIFNDFSFNAPHTFEVGSVTLEVGPWGLQFMDSKNLLFVGHDASYERNEGYNYGRYYILNSNSGDILDTIDVAGWNFSQAGVYNNPDSLGTASGYAATYNLDFDENFNVYAAAYYGWSIEKWNYSEELPTVQLTITNVESTNDVIPKEISLEQNYPNPFNPTTTIEFSINKASDVDLNIFNVNGELVASVLNSNSFNAGNYKITFDASNLASGIYFYKLRVGQQILTKKMTLLK